MPKKNSKNIDNVLGYYYLQELQKNIERTLFLWAKIKTQTLSENVTLDPEEYVCLGSPLYYLQQLLGEN